MHTAEEVKAQPSSELVADEIVPMKCRACRFVLLNHPETPLEDSHGQRILSVGTALINDVKSSTSPCISDVWYIPDSSIPYWLKERLNEEGWLKGKITCPKCSARLGSYNFVSGMKCSCRLKVVAPVHIVKSKVDFTPSFQISTLKTSSELHEESHAPLV